jgi:hypothetical protein
VKILDLLLYTLAVNLAKVRTKPPPGSEGCTEAGIRIPEF